MARKSAFTLKKSGDTYQIHHRGYPTGGLARFHCSVGIAAALMAVPLATELGSRTTQADLLAAGLLLLYGAIGYLIYLPFAVLGGTMSFTPKNESISFSKNLLGRETEVSRQIPWEGKLETEIDQVGFRVKGLPLSFYRVKVVTDFMTYHVATFGPGLSTTADDLAKAVKKARYGRAKIDFDALKGAPISR